jgi:predicted metal-dependent HD superfamily phosphohydrolase
MPSIEQWIATWKELGVSITPAVLGEFESLIARYSEPHRTYHTVHHLDECFGKLAAVRAVAEHPAEVEAALWFHDAVHEKLSTENEAKSADLAVSKVRAAGGSRESAERISALIMATRHAAVPQDSDAMVLVDVDLAILGETPERFDEYERQVRAEYAWVPGFLFNRERKNILKEFLARPAIFNTKLFRERYEAQARANIQRSITRLGG